MLTFSIFLPKNICYSFYYFCLQKFEAPIQSTFINIYTYIAPLINHRKLVINYIWPNFLNVILKVHTRTYITYCLLQKVYFNLYNNKSEFCELLHINKSKNCSSFLKNNRVNILKYIRVCVRVYITKVFFSKTNHIFIITFGLFVGSLKMVTYFCHKFSYIPTGFRIYKQYIHTYIQQEVWK